MSDLIYTNIQHIPRKKRGLTMNEYCICDMIYHLSNNNKYQWCIKSKDGFGEDLGLSKRSVFSLIQKMIDKGFIEKDENTKHIRTTQLWYDEFIIYTKDTSPQVKKVHCDSEESSHLVKKVHHDSEETSPNNNIYNNKEKEKEIYNKKEEDFFQKNSSDSFSETSLSPAPPVPPSPPVHQTTSVINKQNRSNAIRVWDTIKTYSGVVDGTLSDCVFLYNKLLQYQNIAEPIDVLHSIIKGMIATGMSKYYSIASPSKISNNLGTIYSKLLSYSKNTTPKSDPNSFIG